MLLLLGMSCTLLGAVQSSLVLACWLYNVHSFSGCVVRWVGLVAIGATMVLCRRVWARTAHCHTSCLVCTQGAPSCQWLHSPEAQCSPVSCDPLCSLWPSLCAIVCAPLAYRESRLPARVEAECLWSSPTGLLQCTHTLHNVQSLCWQVSLCVLDAASHQWCSYVVFGCDVQVWWCSDVVFGFGIQMSCGVQMWCSDVVFRCGVQMWCSDVVFSCACSDEGYYKVPIHAHISWNITSHKHNIARIQGLFTHLSSW